ncbi:GH3 family domain-containing protein [Lacunisphaera limnophila]|nr:GH3 auxin-responsive promoter family protein [Lacunisphaera limnophila]
MTLAPRFLVTLWAGLRVAGFARRLKRRDHDLRAQHQAFARLVAQSARTEFGRAHGLAATLTYAQFCAQVPLRTLSGFQPFITRMAAGETDVLLPGRCPLFVETAGTTGPSPLLLPAPEAVLDHFCLGLRDALFHYARRAGHTRVFLGRHLHLGASIAVAENQGRYRTSLDGLLTLCVSAWAEANLRSPPGEVAVLPDGPDKLAATVAAMRALNVTLVAGTPDRLCALADQVRADAGGTEPTAPLATLWPNLECCLHAGAPTGLFTEALRAALGPKPRLHEVYLSAEGVFAAQDEASPAALRLIADAGVFFEFLPLPASGEVGPDLTGTPCVPLEGIRTGVDYVPVITTPAGLCRCVTHDIVRFVSVNPPRLQVVGRTGFRLNAQGERLTERDLLAALQAVCQRNGWAPISFHVAPYAQRLGAGQKAQVHEWWIELRTHSMRTPMANVLAPELDAELCHHHPDYAQRRASGALGLPLIRLVMPGLFERWAHEQGKVSSASKLPRCRPDRLIADQLAALAPFYQGTIAPF